MEKRERRERYRSHQALKQKHSTSGRSEQSKNNISNRDAHDTRDNRDKEKTQPLPKVEEKKVIDHTAIPDPHMFDNLKRETDDIAALTAKKHTKRQVFSNWAKYETLPDEDDNQRIGADYETLLRSAQIGSHFQLRSERSWDPKSLPAQGAAFTINLGVMAASLACLPLYEKLNLSKDLFSTDDLEQMHRQARYAKAKLEALPQSSKGRGKSAEKDGLALYGPHLEKLMERAPSGDQTLPPPVASAQNPEEDEHKNEESDGFNFGTIQAPTKDSPVSVLQMKERTDPPKNERQERATPPKEDATERAGDENGEIPPVEEETHEVPVVERSPLQPLGTSRSQPSQDRTPELEGEEVVTKEEQHDEPPVQETGGKKKSRGRNKGNKRKSLELDPEGPSQSSLSGSGIPSTNNENSSFRNVEKEEVPASSKPKVHESKPNIAKEKAAIDEEKIHRVPSEVVPSSDKSARRERTPNFPGANVMSPTEPDSSVVKSEGRNTASAKKDDELDELLSLRQPAASQHVMNFAVPTSAVKASIDEDEISPVPKPVIPEKKEDLEDWLDSMLDD